MAPRSARIVALTPGHASTRTSTPSPPWHAPPLSLPPVLNEVSPAPARSTEPPTRRGTDSTETVRAPPVTPGARSTYTPGSRMAVPTCSPAPHAPAAVCRGVAVP